ncbi:hypothetical protein VI817_003364 [Penicillium citrinum]|nr:hypothetical protein VI817_003364 [Penicillium citrinum]
MSNTEKSAILFSNQAKTTFILDIPQSIKQAQSLSPHQKKTQRSPPLSISARQEFKNTHKCLLSTAPLTEPYPTSTEPKSESARAKVLARIPESERVYHEGILPVVNDALECIKDEFGEQQEWCLARYCADENRVSAEDLKREDDDCASVSKRRRLYSAKEPSEYSGKNPDYPHPGSTGLPENSRSWSNEFDQPPVILSSTSENNFQMICEMNGIVKNPSFETARLSISNHEIKLNEVSSSSRYIIPPRSNFILCTLPLSSQSHDNNAFSFESTTTSTRNNEQQPIPGLSKDQKFNLILFDPPWPNKSVRRSKHYQTHPYAEMEFLTQQLTRILQIHAQPPTPDANSNNPPKKPTIAAIWITNAEKARRAAYNTLNKSGFRVIEEWIWVKVTNKGIPITPINGLWRKPYEILIIGQRGGFNADDFAAMNMNVHRSSISGSYSESDFHSNPSREKQIIRRVIAAVPDIHSRKPNLRDLFEDVFFSECDGDDDDGSYVAMEVFARNLTAGWWGCGNEVMKFNDEGCWVDSDLI